MQLGKFFSRHANPSCLLSADISLQDKMVIYDNEKRQIGWVTANCDRIPKSSLSLSLSLSFSVPFTKVPRRHSHRSGGFPWLFTVWIVTIMDIFLSLMHRTGVSYSVLQQLVVREKKTCELGGISKNIKQK